LHGSFYELQTAQPNKYGAWLIDDRVSSDNLFYIATKFDMRFLCLPFIEKADKYSPLDQIIMQQDGCDRIPLIGVESWHLDEMCDVNDVLGDILLYRRNDSKAIHWLKSKIASISTVLAQQRLKKMSSTHTSTAKTFNSSAQRTSNDSSQETVSTTTDTTKFIVERVDTLLAIQIISDYLSDSMMAKLAKEMEVDISDIQQTKASTLTKRKADWEAELEIERETMVFTNPVVAKANSTNSDSAAQQAPKVSEWSVGSVLLMVNVRARVCPSGMCIVV
jgi:Ydr279p protein family (RNase H2 complex component) wHTH domain